MVDRSLRVGVLGFRSVGDSSVMSRIVGGGIAIDRNVRTSSLMGGIPRDCIEMGRSVRGRGVIDRGMGYRSV